METTEINPKSNNEKDKFIFIINGSGDIELQKQDSTIGILTNSSPVSKMRVRILDTPYTL